MAKLPKPNKEHTFWAFDQKKWEDDQSHNGKKNKTINRLLRLSKLIKDLHYKIEAKSTFLSYSMSTAILDGKKLILHLYSTISFERTKDNMEMTGVWYERAIWKCWHFIKNDVTFQGVELHEKPLNLWFL